ncbi:hypothetical protein [Geodermatophilus sp. URMC 64]
MKNPFVMNVEFSPGVDERLELPVVSLVRCDYVWRRTDRWIDFPWSALPPVVSRPR